MDQAIDRPHQGLDALRIQAEIETADRAQKPGQLALYDDVRRDLAQLDRVDEVKVILDKAAALQEYARRAKDTDLIQHATNIRMQAERRAGELLIKMGERHERAGQGEGEGKGRKPQPLLKLADLGVTKTQSSRWQQLAALDKDRFETRIEQASAAAYDRLTRSFVREQEVERARARHAQAIEHGCTVRDLVVLAESGKQFPVIYADPPWPSAPWNPAIARGVEHYDECTVEQIKALPVAPLAADDCVLLLWAISPQMPAALEVMAAWGFVFRTFAFTWIKTNPSATVLTVDGNGLFTGMGHYTQANAEYCLLGTKGTPSRLAKDVHSVVLAPVGEHSVKPEEVRRRIERLFGGPYLELYGRKPVPGWSVWGNEIPRAVTGAGASVAAHYAA